MASGRYTVLAEAQTISTAITILELTAASTAALELYRAWISQGGSTTSAMARIQILRKSGTITGTATPPTANPLEVGMPAFGGTVKWKATAEGTDGAVIYSDSFNVLNGWLWLPVPEERIMVPPSGIIALKFPAAPASHAFTYGLSFREIG